GGYGGATSCRPGELMTNRTQQVTERTRSFGGNLLVEASMEIIFPLPFIEDQRMFQTAFFIDAGNVFDTSCSSTQFNCYDFSAEKLSMAAGIGLTWTSAFSTMTFSVSKALPQNEDDEDDGGFSFTLGPTF